MKVTTDEWLSELERLSSRKADDGKTAQEICEATGRSERWVQKMLQRASRAGWLVLGKRTVVRVDGIRAPVPVYRIVKPKKP